MSVATAGLFACNKQNADVNNVTPNNKITLSEPEYKSLYYDSLKEIPEDQVISLVSDFLNNTKKKVGTKSTVTIKNVSVKPFAIPTKSTARSAAPLYNVTTVSNTGDTSVAVISAYARCPQIIAFVNGGKNLNAPETPEAVKMLLNSSLLAYEDYQKQADKVTDSLKVAATGKIAASLAVTESEVNLAQVKSRIAIAGNPATKATLEKNPISTRPSHTIFANYMPIMLTAWGQGMPYNRTMPQSCPDNWLWDYRYAISSASIAIAQVLAFYEVPITMYGYNMDWYYLTENKEIWEETDYFGAYVQDPLLRRNMVAELMRGVTAEAGITYTCTGSSTNITTVRNYLNAKEVTLGTETTYNFPAIRSSIADLKLVLMYGQTAQSQGHWWLIDGAMVTRITGTVSPDFNFVHVNMGLGETYNGYYLMGDNRFETGFATFQQGFKLYPNIVRRY
ncbi:Peptidase C10 family protein [Chitinophaga sp. CF118]|nr:Peptidase C10 family protein [Chitinophaga sp. CF118]